MSQSKICAGIAFVGVLTSLSGAFGATIPPELNGFNIEVFYNGSSYWSTQNDPGSISMIEQNTDGVSWHIEGGKSLGGGAAGLTFSLDVDTDPFISSSFNVTNGLGVVQDFTILVTMPAAPPIGPTSFINGSLSGSVLDANGTGGATIATIPGSGFYEALVDGGVAKTLYSDPPGYSYTAPLQGTANIPTVMYGPEVGPPMLATIGIRNMFSLTPGDSGQMVSTFNIVAIPAPGGTLFFGLAGVAAIRRRRR